MTQINAKSDLLMTGPLGTSMVNAGSSQFRVFGVVNPLEEKITAAIAYAASIGAKYCYVPDSLLPYNASLVTFNTAVRMVREGSNPLVWDVRAYGAAGDGVTDDRLAIVAAQAGSQNNPGGVVAFPGGNYAVSDYVDANPGTVWLGQGIGEVAGVALTTITATGTNKGCLRFRPGTIGNEAPVSGQRNVTCQGITFSGNAAAATTGHLVNCARASLLRFVGCAFNNTQGQGFKDDQSTLTGAAGAYFYGCEVVSFINCQFENNTHATNGAGYCLENACHKIGFVNCYFNNNTVHCRYNGVGATPTGLINHYDCFFIFGTSVAYTDLGGINNIRFDSCWNEQQSASGATAVWFDGLAGSQTRIFNVRADNCVIKGGAGTVIATSSQLILDSSTWKNCRFDTFSTAFAHTFTNGGNAVEECDLFSVSNLFVGGDPTNGGFAHSSTRFVLASGTFLPNIVAVGQQNKSVTLVDGATVAVDLSKGNRFILSTALSRTISNVTNFPNSGYTHQGSITIKNTSGGAITTTFSANWHLAGAWVDPGAGKQRTLWFEEDGQTGICYEISRSAADVTP